MSTDTTTTSDQGNTIGAGQAPPPQGLFEAGQLIVGARSGTFVGDPWADYELLNDGDLKLRCDFQPVSTPDQPARCLHRVSGTVPANTRITVDEKGLVRIETPQGHKLDIWRVPAEKSPLGGKPYLNCYATDGTFPASFSTATGILPQFSGTDASAFKTTTGIQ